MSMPPVKLGLSARDELGGLDTDESEGDRRIHDLLWKDIGERQFVYEQVFGSVSGRRVLADLLIFCRYNGELFDGSSSHQTAYNCGRHRVAQRIVSYANMTPDELKRIIDSHVRQRSYDPFKADG